MLVLSRRVGEKIILPTINTTFTLVASKSGVVRLGIDAPPEVQVFREEIFDPERWLAEQGQQPPADPLAGHLRVALRKQLNASMAALAQLRRQLDKGLTNQAGKTFARLEKELHALQEQMKGMSRPPAPSANKRRKALLVEDDPQDRELLAGFLRSAGVDVDTAGDGADALDYLRKQPRPDAVLLDMLLPRFDGPSVIKEVRNDPNLGGLKIFGVSGHAPEEFDLERGPHGVDAWFNKPINPEVLLKTLKELPCDS